MFTCNWVNQIHEKHTKKQKTKRHANLCCYFKGALPSKLALLLLFQESFGNLISQKMIFSSLFSKIISIKKQVGTQFIVMKGNKQKPNMGRKYSSKMPMNKNK